jgi:hypothetical protein
MSDILGSHGVDIDIVSGRPLTHSFQPKAGAAQDKYHEAVQNSMALRAELQKSRALSILTKLYVNILTELAKQDVRCQTIEAIVREFGFEVDMAPKIAEERMMQIMGPSLARQYQEAKHAAP